MTWTPILNVPSLRLCATTVMNETWIVLFHLPRVDKHRKKERNIFIFHIFFSFLPFQLYGICAWTVPLNESGPCPENKHFAP